MFTKSFDRRIYVFLGVLAVSGAVGFSFGVYALWGANAEKNHEPAQPIRYSHRQHAGNLKMDCRFCHSAVEYAATANLPTLDVCMGCHGQIRPATPGGQDPPDIRKLKEHWETKAPVEWVLVNNLADFVYFDHSRHVTTGLKCPDCHGPIETMDRVRRVNAMKMAWCLECHRKAPPAGYAVTDGRATRAPTDCSTCHR